MIDRTFFLTQNIVICFRMAFPCTVLLCDKRWYLLKTITEEKDDIYPQTLERNAQVLFQHFSANKETTSTLTSKNLQNHHKNYYTHK